MVLAAAEAHRYLKMGENVAIKNVRTCWLLHDFLSFKSFPFGKFFSEKSPSVTLVLAFEVNQGLTFFEV